MAIAIKNIPVLTGKDAEYFNHLVEQTNNTPQTHITDKMKAAFKAIEERSHKFIARR